MRAPTAVALLLAGALLAAGVPARADDASPWALPPEGACVPAGGLRGWPPGTDAPPVPFQTGDVVGSGGILLLRRYLPPEVWEQRHRFFFEGMRLEIGPCFRDYGPPAFFREATARFGGRATLTPEGGLAGHVAGEPFPRETLDPEDPSAGQRWAWNVALRYQAAGHRGPFRITDVVGTLHRPEHFEGELFKVQLAFRADLAGAGYTAPGARDRHWVAGGAFHEPFAARAFAWRQYRATAQLREAARYDEIHAYVPSLRRVARVGAATVEGLYLPAFTVGTRPEGGAGVSAGPAIGMAPGAGTAAGATLPALRSGFEGLEIRPLLHDFEVVGVQDVLAPLNAARPLYPEARSRSFGTWGVSFADDRWDLRRALVLRATRREKGGLHDVASVVHYVDLQTLQPLYRISYDGRGEVLDVGQMAGRWSDDRPDYPPWPDDPTRPVRVIDPVGAAFVDVDDYTGWRRESWTSVGTPPGEQALRSALSTSDLTRGR